MEVELIFKGRRILIVEDVPSLASAMQETFEALGAIVLGPVDQLHDAVLSIAKLSPEFVVLDLNLNGASAAPVVDYLIARGIRFVITTGHASGPKAARYIGMPILIKPFRPEDVVKALAPMLALAD